MTKLWEDKQEKHLKKALKETYLTLIMKVWMILEIVKARMIKFHKYEHNFPYT